MEELQPSQVCIELGSRLTGLLSHDSTGTRAELYSFGRDIPRLPNGALAFVIGNGRTVTFVDPMIDPDSSISGYGAEVVYSRRVDTNLCLVGARSWEVGTEVKSATFQVHPETNVFANSQVMAEAIESPFGSARNLELLTAPFANGTLRVGYVLVSDSLTKNRSINDVELSLEFATGVSLEDCLNLVADLTRLLSASMWLDASLDRLG